MSAFTVTALLVLALAVAAWAAIIAWAAILTSGNGHIPEVPERTAGRDGEP